MLKDNNMATIPTQNRKSSQLLHKYSRLTGISIWILCTKWFLRQLQFPHPLNIYLSYDIKVYPCFWYVSTPRQKFSHPRSVEYSINQLKKPTTVSYDNVYRHKEWLLPIVHYPPCIDFCISLWNMVQHRLLHQFVEHGTQGHFYPQRLLTELFEDELSDWTYLCSLLSSSACNLEIILWFALL